MEKLYVEFTDDIEDLNPEDIVLEYGNDYIDFAVIDKIDADTGKEVPEEFDICIQIREEGDVAALYDPISQGIITEEDIFEEIAIVQDIFKKYDCESYDFQCVFFGKKNGKSCTDITKEIEEMGLRYNPDIADIHFVC